MFFRKMDESCTLTKGMADRLGVSLSNAENPDSGRDAVSYRSAVLRCMACKEHESCIKLQTENETLLNAPVYCRNW
jgi:hypothetical protein